MWRADLVGVLVDNAFAPIAVINPELMVLLSTTAVNAGEKMYQRAGVKVHHGWMRNAATGGLLLRDKQDEKRIASPANVAETSSVAEPSVLRCLN